MKITRVGGPLLGRKQSTLTNNKKFNPLSSHVTLEPLITPSLPKQEQFVVLPSTHFITVLSYKTGQRVACLVPKSKSNEKEGHNDEPAVFVESVCLATFARQESIVEQSAADILQQSKDVDNGDESSSSSNDSEVENDHGDDASDDHVLLIGCSNGTLCEFSLDELIHPDRAVKAVDCGPYQVTGPCYLPRRIFQLTENKHAVKHLTSPRFALEHNRDGIVVYALTETKSLSSSGTGAPFSKVNFTLMKVTLPVFVDLGTFELFKDASRVQTIDRLKCRVGRDKSGHYEDSTPFCMVSVAKEISKAFSSSQISDYDVFLVVARSMTFHVYHERVLFGRKKDESTAPPPSKVRSVNFTVSHPNVLTALCIAPNGADVTCGYLEGDIRVMSSLLPRTLEYLGALDSGQKPKHPSKALLVRRVHWHAHPVTALAYHGLSSAVDPMLYSGGEESVLVTWQLSRGSYRPADVLPRLAKGGIVHICCPDGTQSGDANGILIYCEDNSLQLFESHNRSLQWKVQGLASSGVHFSGGNKSHLTDNLARIWPAFSSNPNALILSGLVGAPGYLHWFDYEMQRVTRQLEVAPYNRVSRTEKEDKELPAPSVTHCAFSTKGHELLTIDVSPTENASIGAPENMGSTQTMGVVSTLRFWTYEPGKSKGNNAPYTLTALMTYPHGKENRVSAVALSCDGQFACTVSNEEKAFRLWQRLLTDVEEGDNRSRRAPVWVCKYKVTTPAGYSNFATARDAVAFSADGTILSIAYGDMITLWDYKEASLLKSLRHLDDDTAPIDSLDFIETALLHDLILTKSSTGVRLQSPYGNRGQASWSCILPAHYKEAKVSHVSLIPSNDAFAISMVFPKEQKSRILLVDAITGSALIEKVDGTSSPVLWEVDGIVHALGSSGKTAKRQSAWVPIDGLASTIGTSEKPGLSICVFATTASGDLLLLQTDEDESRSGMPRNVARTTYGTTLEVPQLRILRRDGAKRLRATALPIEPLAKFGNTFGSFLGTEDGGDADDSAPLPTSDLPALSGTFTRAFVGRRLAKRRRAESN